ncbi:MAG: nucleoside hydrolase [Alphaproteobacteria bacterium]|nr:nucleoside hydrolase [Alphaproteobacteria bacterium]
MAARPIIIDCDPGQDDAVALLLALASPADLDIRGITAVAGNVPLALTERNARLMVELSGRKDVRVFAGCSRPMLRKLVTAEAVHGQTGLDGCPIHAPTVPLERQHAATFLVEELLAAPDDAITLVPVGPLTNIALALIMEPRILPKIREIVLMGGAFREGGNTTPAAEFNIYVDSHAADVVFRCGRPITVLSLDVTHQALTTPSRLAAFRKLGTKVGGIVGDMLAFYDRHDIAKYGMPGGPLHDPTTIAFLLAPDLFTGKRVSVEIDIADGPSLGATRVDWWGVTQKPANALWIERLNADGFYALLTERIGRL